MTTLAQRNTRWFDQAICPGKGKELDRICGKLTGKRRREACRDYCYECPVKRECAADTRTTGAEYVPVAGLWVGASTKATKAALDRIIAGTSSPDEVSAELCM